MVHNGHREIVLDLAIKLVAEKSVWMAAAVQFDCAILGVYYWIRLKGHIQKF